MFMAQAFDLNLLKVLDLLLEEKSVTKTANRLCVTQSAVSKNLSRLREMYDDPILLRCGKEFIPTPKAKELSLMLKPILQNINVLTQKTSFEPEECERVFRFEMMEVAYSFTLPEFMPSILETAPLIKFDTQTWNDSSLQRLQNCEIDFAIKCFEQDFRSENHLSKIPKNFEYAKLSKDFATCVVRKGHPILSEEWTLDGFMQQKHIQVTGGGTRHWLLDEVLIQMGLERNVVIEIPDFHGAFRLCERTDLVLCAPYGQVQDMIELYNLEMVGIPIEMEHGVDVLIWNQYFNHDQAHKWLRERIIESMRRANFVRYKF
ncbi:LysR family transcriptional regulator [Shewanella sp. OPT22]|nr:LysR family transcriptional regulator [Shewanella sp. OPT22]